MSAPLVTALIDSYNYGHFIEDAIDSVLAQEFPQEQLEILVVDDGSTDDTAERVKKYGARIKYIYKKNGGQASAFNLGLAHAQGKYVALLDADDYWLPNKLSRILPEFEAHPDVAMVYHRLQEFDTATGNRRDQFLPPHFLEMFAANRNDLLRYVLYPTSALAFRRDCLDRLLPIPEALTIQADSHLTGLIIFIAPILAINESLAVYRVHGANLFHAPGTKTTLKQVRRRVETRATLIAGMKSWLKTAGYDLSANNLHDLFAQWDLTQEADEFALKPPNNMQLCRHLVRYNRYFRPRMNRNHLLVNYINAVGALALGYKHLHYLDSGIASVRRSLKRQP